MKPELQPDRPFNPTVHAERAYTVQVDRFDHGIPVLGVALHETEHLSVNRDRLLKMGLQPGEWLKDLKMAVRRRRPGSDAIEAAGPDGATTRLRIEELAREILTRTPGQKIAYLTDLSHTTDNVDRAVRLAAGADLVICETAFLHEDLNLARERCHLTARQAGELARAAGAARLAPFHFSPRYDGREAELLAEAGEAFGGPIVALPSGPIWNEEGPARML
jgi:ribonuclease Z